MLGTIINGKRSKKSKRKLQNPYKRRLKRKTKRIYRNRRREALSAYKRETLDGVIKKKLYFGKNELPDKHISLWW